MTLACALAGMKCPVHLRPENREPLQLPREEQWGFLLVFWIQGLQENPQSLGWGQRGIWFPEGCDTLTAAL